MTDLGANEGADGGSVRHVPVMLGEVLAALSPGCGKTIVDGTFGAGGYSSAILEKGARVIAIDRDPDALTESGDMVRQYKDRLQLVEGRFSLLDQYCDELGYQAVDGVVLDIGVSSMQLDRVERGFSFMKDGPLDMRMAKSGISAADVVNQAKREDLTRIIGILGEERKASLISKAIHERRQASLFVSTLDLAGVIERVIGRRANDKIHPATRTFQALRIFVNRELEELAKAMFAAERILCEGGKLAIVTFHSLEDRMVKQFFADRSGKTARSRHLPDVPSPDAVFVQETSSAVKAGKAEAEANPRARSAKMRFGTRTGANARNENLEIFGLPRLVEMEAGA